VQTVQTVRRVWSGDSVGTSHMFGLTRNSGIHCGFGTRVSRSINRSVVLTLGTFCDLGNDGILAQVHLRRRKTAQDGVKHKTNNRILSPNYE
jgi:hypothetical protein